MEIKQEIETKLNKTIAESSNEEIYLTLLHLIKEKASENQIQGGKKRVYYISAEFLIGKLLSNNLINLGIYDQVSQVLKENGKNLA